jgi:protein-S-isoprenylcysteine O-methyltransferase Ste14
MNKTELFEKTFTKSWDLNENSTENISRLGIKTNLKNSSLGGLRGSIWFIYIVIVFEILYMISPFALYYYSLYKEPLKLLQSNPNTAFLTFNILPHFSSHNSIFISVLNYICWPLVIIGLALFLFSFCQIYWAKFTRKGTVSGGLYKYIRHPQYLALAILGLGSTIYWPRFIVYIMYFTMLFLYYFLAKQEEKICRMKYGKTYIGYAEATGMFLPLKIENYFKKIHGILPEGGFKRITVLTFIYIVYISAIISLGFIIRNYSISKINAYYTENMAVISTAALEKQDIKNAVDIIMNDKGSEGKILFQDGKKYLIYLVPAGWFIPELGFEENENDGYLLNSSTHGNSGNFNKNFIVMLIAEPNLINGKENNEDIIKNTKSFNPLYEVTIDMVSNKIISWGNKIQKGKWEGIPVPVY